MGKKISWSKRAQRDLSAITTFWDDHNASPEYGDRLTSEAILSAELLANHPEIGIRTNKDNVFKKIVSKHFFMFCRLHTDSVTILRFWNSRKNPRKMKRYLK